MNKTDRIKALQARLAQLQLKKAELPRVASPQPLPMSSMLAAALPPIRIELAVKAQPEPAKEVQVSGLSTPSPG